MRFALCTLQFKLCTRVVAVDLLVTCLTCSIDLAVVDLPVDLPSTRSYEERIRVEDIIGTCSTYATVLHCTAG